MYPCKKIIYVSAVGLVGTGEVGPITGWPPRFILKSSFSNYIYIRTAIIPSLSYLYYYVLNIHVCTMVSDVPVI